MNQTTSYIKELEKLLDKVPIAICLVDFDGSIKFTNQLFISLFDYKNGKHKTLKNILDQIIPNEEMRLEFVEQLQSKIKTVEQSNEEAYIGDFEIITKKNAIHFLEIRINTYDDYFILFFNDITARKKTEKAIEESKLRYQLLSNLTYEGILLHKNGVAFDMNEAFAKMFQYEPKELIGQNVVELLGGADDRSIMYHHMRTNFLLPYEVTVYKKSGEKFLAEVIGREIEIDGEKARAVSVRDISERKKKDKELNEHQLFIQRVTEQSPDIIYIYNVESKKNIYINKDLREILGYQKEELHESSSDIIEKLIHPDDIKQFTNFYQNIHNLSEDYVFEFTYRLKTRNGQWRWFAGKEKEFQREDGRIITMIGTIQDITSQKEYERALLESEERLTSIFENAPMQMVLITEDRKILKMNNNALSGAGRLKDDDLNKIFGEAINCISSFNKKGGCGKDELCDKCTLRKLVANTFNKKQNHYKVEVSINIKENRKLEERFLLVSTTLMRRMNPSAVLVTLDDITDRKLMEIDLQKAKEVAIEHNQLKTAFLQNMSHEIRTPMNGIIGFSEMLSKEEVTDDKRKLYADVIINSSKQLLHIVNDILDISRIETGQVNISENELNVNYLLNELYTFHQPQSDEKNIDLIVQLSLKDEASSIISDYAKVRQILNNLLSNALKFTHEGHIVLGYEIKDDNITFYVEDTGIGIEKKYHEKIFEEFRQVEHTTTRQYGGTGLGLAISKAYSKLLNGKLWLTSELGKGSTFYFEMPYQPSAAKFVLTDDENYSLIKPKITGNPTVLIAEDEKTNFLLLKEIMDDLKIKTIRAKDGAEAIKIVKTIGIALVLLDIKMPKVNGYEAIAEIKKIRPDLPVVAQTAFATSDDKIKVEEAEFDDYLPKPIQNKALYKIISKYLGK